MTEAADRETQGDKQPEAVPEVVSSRVPVIAVCLAALAIIGAATANFMPRFNQLSLLSVHQLPLPDFSRFSPPNFNRVAALPPPNPAPVLPPAPVLVPDPVVRAGLRDIQSSQQQNADVLEQLTQNAATQQADLKRVTRQLALLTAQVSSLQNTVTAPLTTSSISPSMTSSIAHQTASGISRPNPRARVVHASRKVIPPVLPPVLPATLPSLPGPAGPVSVGGAPLSPAAATGSGAG